MAEELTLSFPCSDVPVPVEGSNSEDFSMRDFLRQFRSVRLLRLRVNPFVQEIGLYLKQDEDGEEAILPVLEEIEISIVRLKGHSTDEEFRRRAAEAMLAFEPCDRAGRLVKISHCKQSEMQARNGKLTVYP